MASTYAPRHNQAAQRKLEAKQRKAKAKARRRSKRTSPAIGTVVAVAVIALGLTHSAALSLLLSGITLAVVGGIVLEGHTRPPKGKHARVPQPIDPEAEAGAIVEAAEQILVEEAHSTPITGVPVGQVPHAAPKKRSDRFLFAGTLFYLALTAIAHVSDRHEREAKEMQEEIDYQLWEGWRKPPYGSE